MNSETRGSVPLYLNKINSDKKAIECAKILEAFHPCHNERLWLCGFLRYCGYPMTEVTNIIHDRNHWCDYNERATAYQVASVFHQRPQRTQNHQARKVRKWDLSPVEVLRIRRQHSISLSKRLCEEHMNRNSFPHPERLSCSDFNPSAEFLTK